MKEAAAIKGNKTFECKPIKCKKTALKFVFSFQVFPTSASLFATVYKEWTVIVNRKYTMKFDLFDLISIIY